MMRGWVHAFRRRLPWRQGYARGGLIHPRPINSGDSIPATLSPCRSTVRRPGETWSEADARLLEGDNL